MRIYDIAKELSVPPKEIIDMLATIGVAGKVPSSSIEDTAARSLRQMIENRNNPQPREEPATTPAPASFQNFRQGARRPSSADVPADVSSDVIEDYRDYVAPDE
ncbi:MAG TPA: translation initiation factor IF-2 N-terminal domain-containing protein, partial [Abditibacteriaceae bacterium]|nr:translation initiation factor IF-2 N-terminal domain-containing protein [Abditibacteriaceae bacterium]